MKYTYTSTATENKPQMRLAVDQPKTEAVDKKYQAKVRRKAKELNQLKIFKQ